MATETQSVSSELNTKIISKHNLETFLNHIKNKFVSNEAIYEHVPASVKQVFLGYQNKQKFKMTFYDALITGGAVGASTSVYWPWVIRVDDKIDHPIAKYYMYYSSDHAGTSSAIYLATSDDLTKGWVSQGTVFRNAKTSGSGYYETETPSVIWDEVNSRFIMYFQSAGSVSGEAQTSFYVTSTDGINWSGVTKMFDLDGERIPGNLHNGYIMPFEFQGSLFAYSLMGGGNGGSAFHWSEDGGYTWITDHRRLGRLGLKPSEDKFMFPNHCTPVSINGQMYFLGLWSNFSSGTLTKITRVALMPMSDYRTCFGRPYILFNPTGSYQGDNIRTLSVFNENGKLYIFYNSAVGSNSYIHLMVLEADNSDRIVPSLTFITQPSSGVDLYSGRYTNVSISVEAELNTGNAINYQWYINTANTEVGWTEIIGATDNNYVFPEDLEEGEYYYRCVVSAGDATPLTSEVCHVTVIVPKITITEQPLDYNFDVGEVNATLSVAATVNDTSALSYQWYLKDSVSGEFVALEGATENTYTLPTDLEEGNYEYICGVSSTSLPEIRSEISYIVVEPPLAPVINILTQPVNFSQTAGAIDGILSVEAELLNSSETLTYEWRKATSETPSNDDEIVQTSTSNTYTLDTTLTAGTYYYYCIVSIPSATVTLTSRVAIISVIEVILPNYLAYYELIGEPNAAAPELIQDTSGKSNVALRIGNITNYNADGYLYLRGNASGTAETGHYIYLAGLTLPSSYKLHFKYVQNTGSNCIGYGFSNRLMTSETIDYNNLLGTYSPNTARDGFKVESSILTDINATYPAGSFASNVARRTLTVLSVDMIVVDDVITYNIEATTTNGVTNITGTQATPGFTNSISTHLTFGNLEYGTNAYKRAPNACLTEFWVEEV